MEKGISIGGLESSTIDAEKEAGCDYESDKALRNYILAEDVPYSFLSGRPGRRLEGRSFRPIKFAVSLTAFSTALTVAILHCAL